MTWKILDKNSSLTNTCYNKNYISFYQGINLELKDTFFSVFIYQFLIVSLIYVRIGKGKYWKTIYISSLMGLIGSIIEHSTLAYICQLSQLENKTRVIPFFIEEIFWVINEYSVPYLNLLKIKTLMEQNMRKYFVIALTLLFIPFAFFRLYNRYDRMMEGVLNTKISERCHGIAYGTIAIADMICTFCIIYYVKKKIKNGRMNASSITNYIMNSSYTILICVDIVSIFLSSLYIVVNVMEPGSEFSNSPMPFHCFKSIFILILAVDGMIFRNDTSQGSSNKKISLKWILNRKSSKKKEALFFNPNISNREGFSKNKNNNLSFIG
ncbi:hypothetical protein U3516DRAFT_857748 [Neocallimastix sp. 'constans']